MKQQPTTPPPRRISPERARARARMLARKRRRAAQCKLALAVAALLLLLALIVFGAVKCASGLGDAQETGAPQDTAAEDPALSSDPSDTRAPESETQAPVTDPPATDPPETDPPLPAFAFPEEMASRYALLLHRGSGRVIAEKNASKVTYPASITKIMTVLVALEKLENPDATVTITADLINRLVERNAARAGFEAGEKVSATDMMYAALLPSGADGSVGLAELVAGSESAFARLMNQKADALGMDDTNFVNATGLHEDKHRSTCHDLAILLNAALDNPRFREIFTTTHHRSSATEEHPNGLYMRSTMDTYLSAEQIGRDYFLGGKTGYTGQAGLCLASLAQWEGEEYILITLGAGDGENTPRYQVHDAVLVFDAFFASLS